MPRVSQVYHRLPVPGQKVRRAAYCRVSTAQANQLESEARQERHFARLLAADPATDFVGVYADVGISGLSARGRAGFHRLLADCRAGKIDCVHTKSISRFARNVTDALRYIRELKELGVDVYFEKERLHSISPEGELLLTLMASLAEAESVSLSENIKWSKRRRFSCGSPQSLPIRGVLGLDRDKAGQIVVIPREAELVRRIYREYLDGWGVSAIAARLNAEGAPTPRGGRRWDVADIVNNLKNEKHCGDCLFQKTFKPDLRAPAARKNSGQLPMYFAEGVLPPLVDRRTWELAQLEMAWREKQGLKVGGPENPFKQRLRCAHCGRVMVTESWRGVKRFWRCGSFTDRPADGRPPCASLRIPYDRPTQVFVQAWNTLVRSEPDALLSPAADPLTQYRREDLAALLHQVGALTDFRYDLFIRAVSHLTVAADGAVTVTFRAGIQITID